MTQPHRPHLRTLEDVLEHVSVPEGQDFTWHTGRESTFFTRTARRFKPPEVFAIDLLDKDGSVLKLEASHGTVVKPGNRSRSR